MAAAEKALKDAIDAEAKSTAELHTAEAAVNKLQIGDTSDLSTPPASPPPSAKSLPQPPTLASNRASVKSAALGADRSAMLKAAASMPKSLAPKKSATPVPMAPAASPTSLPTATSAAKTSATPVPVASSAADEPRSLDPNGDASDPRSLKSLTPKSSPTALPTAASSAANEPRLLDPNPPLEKPVASASPSLPTSSSKMIVADSDSRAEDEHLPAPPSVPLCPDSSTRPASAAPAPAPERDPAMNTTNTNPMGPADQEQAVEEVFEVESREQRKERKRAKKLAKAAKETLVAQQEDSDYERKARRKAEKKAEKKARRKAEKKAEKRAAKEAEKEVGGGKTKPKSRVQDRGGESLDEAGSKSSDNEPITGVKRKRDVSGSEDAGKGASCIDENEELEMQLVDEDDIHSMGLDQAIADICGSDEESDGEIVETKVSFKKEGIPAVPGVKAPKKCKSNFIILCDDM